MATNTFETAIKNYLDKMAADDPFFKDKYENPNKSIAECCKYIISEVSKKRNGQQCVPVEDEEVYGMAIHYYDEENLKVDETPQNVKVAAPQETTEKPANKRKPRKSGVKKAAEVVEEVAFASEEEFVIEPLQFNIF